MKSITATIIAVIVLVAGYFLITNISTNQLTVPDNWNSYEYTSTSTDLSFSLKYPNDWQSPQTQVLGTRERIIFTDGLVIEAGDFYSQEMERNMTAGEAAENDVKANPGDPQRSSITVADILAEKVSFTVPEGHIGTQAGNPIPPSPQDVTDVFLQQSTSSPIIFMRYSIGESSVFDKILRSFRFGE